VERVESQKSKVESEKSVASIEVRGTKDVGRGVMVREYNGTREPGQPATGYRISDALNGIAYYEQGR